MMSLKVRILSVLFISFFCSRIDLKRMHRHMIQVYNKHMRFEPSKEMKIDLLPEQEEQLCTKETIREVFAKDDKNECTAFDIYDGDDMVGFAMFCEYPKGSFFLWNYAIDAKYQNRGIGTKALKELLECMVSSNDVKEFTTTYLWGNEQAKRLYEKAGFIETDVIDEEGCHEVNMLYRIK